VATVEIQKIGPKDIRHVVDLLKTSFEINEVKLFKLIESRLESDNNLLLLAKMDGRTAGVIECCIEPQGMLMSGTVRGRIATLFVKEDARRKGVGSRLMDTARFWFFGAGVDWVVCDVPMNDEGALGFMKKFQFDPKEVTLAKRVETIN